MESSAAVKRLSAIAQEARLDVFRLLVKAGPDGMAAGDIARTLVVPANAGLVRARREGRSIIYAINFEAMRDLLVFLTEDCCGGRAEMCAPLAGVVSRATCSRKRKEARHEASARSRRRR